ncbi:uncharacterized protein MYCGRDRAFT_103568 [Zymoseptoria tritici IPO323]|uniref:BZIP domain-containing protein n=1 Tax=Zymoseptoria tritici (strain CBS 115943 / IPO323) TaxID=336722 RepID=F9X6M4_ZYMTI|nr:uncharacterized protein MYCGRDRAFT_103568 [Zymoseptoria tritici IPO323]EGP89582.1 hypothetical protein MYCGRDRAFT_103568 [Zymoseptoria tritici IPO323]
MDVLSASSLSLHNDLSLNNIMSSPDSSSTYLKMEDLHTTHSTSPAPSAFDDSLSTSQSSPAPVVVHSRQAKKRKSWGQELPEPKTSLPPRKRAKTDDEKEQRRIERIKRNRAAAHNSRERKRQETETLAVALARANAELQAYKKLHGPLPSNIVLPEIQVRNESPEAQTPVPSLVDDNSYPSPASPDDSIFHPTTSIKQEPLDHPTFSLNSLPPAFDTLDAKPSSSSLLLPLDPTQHSAAMLCDLQCRSSLKSSSTTTTTNSPPPSWWTQLFLHLLTGQILTCYRILMVALWTISPSRMARLMAASTLRSTSRSTISSTTPLLLRSTRRRLALCNTATGLRAPREGALTALQRRSLGRDRRVARCERSGRQVQVSRTTRAVFLGSSEDQGVGDDGNEQHGVGHGGDTT